MPDPDPSPTPAATPWKILPLPLPVQRSDGEEKVYLVQPLAYDDGLTLLSAFNGKSDVVTNDSPAEVMFRLCMGETWQQMVDDGLPYPVMFRAGSASTSFQTALVSGLDNEAALRSGLAVWETGVDPEIVAALVAAAKAQERPPKATTSTRSKSSAAARKTPPRASTSTTRSRAATPRKASPAARRSTGTRS